MDNKLTPNEFFLLKRVHKRPEIVEQKQEKYFNLDVIVLAMWM